MAPTALVNALSAAADAVEGSAAELNRLDGYAGDGDLGITMTQAAQALREVLAASEEQSVAQLLPGCGAAMARSAPPPAGLSWLLASCGQPRRWPTLPTTTVEALVRAFAAAIEGIQARGKAAVGDRTLVDGLDAVSNSLALSLAAGLGTHEALDQAARAASASASATADMEPKAGRASWVPERAKGHPDAGCEMLAIALEAVAASVGAS